MIRLSRIGALFVIACALIAPPAGAEPESDPAIQQRFVEAMGLLQTDRAAAAAELLAELATLSDSPRIRLEWARALFVVGRYADSERLFREVLELPGLPWQVEENVRGYLDRIDRMTGAVDLSLAVVSESNPQNFTSVEQVELLGVVLNVVPPGDNGTLTGIEYTIDAYAPLTPGRRLSGHLNASLADYPQATYDELNARAEVIGDLFGNDRLLLKAGSDLGYQNGRRLYRHPYLGLRINRMVGRDRLALDLRAGRLRVDPMPSLDGPRRSARLAWTRYLPASRALTLELGAQHAETRYAVDSHRTLSLGSRLTLPAGWRRSRLEPHLSLDHTRYGAPNLLFGGLREDRRVTAGIDWIARGVRLFGLTPRIGIRWTRNDSSLAYFSYDKTELSLRLE